MKYHLSSALFLIGAVGFYIAGFAGAGAVVLACGFGLEMAFWVRTVRARRRHVA